MILDLSLRPPCWSPGFLPGASVRTLLRANRGPPGGCSSELRSVSHVLTHTALTPPVFRGRTPQRRIQSVVCHAQFFCALPRFSPLYSVFFFSVQEVNCSNAQLNWSIWIFLNSTELFVLFRFFSPITWSRMRGLALSHDHSSGRHQGVEVSNL